MPGYAGNGQAGLVRVNKQAILWQNTDTISAGVYPGALSVAYQLERLDNAFYPWGASFEVIFNGNPGVFDIDIVGANIDQAQNYTYLGMINQVNSYVPGYYVGRWDMPSNIWVKYVAAYVKSLTNAVGATLMVTR
jgi:hypothetical protein